MRSKSSNRVKNTRTRQLLSVQVDVSDVRLLRPSTRLVLAMNSMDVGRRQGAAVSSTLQPDTQLLEEPGTVRTVNSVLKEVLDTSSM